MLGQIVFYQLSGDDAEATGDSNMGAGHVYPAIVTVVHDEPGAVALTVFLNGRESMWIPYALAGTDDGTWREAP